MRVPKSLLPEMKFRYIQGIPSPLTDTAVLSISSLIGIGGQSNQRIGSKVRIQRIRVTYDYSHFTPESAIRMSLVIPKTDSDAPVLTVSCQPWDTQFFTVLKDMMIAPSAGSLIQENTQGFMDFVGPINVDYSVVGGTGRVLRNNVYLSIFAQGFAIEAAAIRSTSVSVWYTDN